MNSASSANYFVLLNKIEGLATEIKESLYLDLSVKVKCSEWFKTGAPFLDTFCYVGINQDKELILRNYPDDMYIASCGSTNGFAEKVKNICPGCGNMDSSNIIFCPSCKEKLFTITPFGKILNGKLRSYKGELYPSVLFEKGKAIRPLRNYLIVSKLYA